jgi:hypothetical protein
MWQRRHELHQSIAERTNFSEGPDQHQSWLDLPLDILAASANVSRHVPAVMQIRDAINEHRVADTRKLVDEALLVEINEASNDPMNKASLLSFRSEIDEGEGNYIDALRHYEEMMKPGTPMARNTANKGPGEPWPRKGVTEDSSDWRSNRSK